MPLTKHTFHLDYEKLGASIAGDTLIIDVQVDSVNFEAQDTIEMILDEAGLRGMLKTAVMEEFITSVEQAQLFQTLNNHKTKN